MKKPSLNFILTPLPFLGDPKRNAPLGVMYLAAVCEKAGYPVAIKDLRDAPVKEAADRITSECDIFAFSATTPEYPACRHLAQDLRARYPKALFVIGGYHATVCPDAIDPVFNTVVRGEGEGSVIKVLEDLEAGRKQRLYTAHHPVDIAKVPWPARHLLPPDSFVSCSLVEKGEPATTVLASRGCAFDCAFCASKYMWSRLVRSRPVADVINEIRHLREHYGVRQLRFQDDALELNRPWLLEFCQHMRSFKMTWRANARADTLTEELMDAMKEAGCDELCFGIESPEQAVLDKSNKKMKIEKAYTTLAAARAKGIKTRIFLIIGLPGQNTDVADNMIAFIKEARPDAVDLSTFVPFPGCDIYEHPDAYNVAIRDQARDEEYVMTRGLFGNEKDMDFVVRHDVLSNEQLKDLRSQVLDFIQQYRLVQNK